MYLENIKKKKYRKDIFLILIIISIALSLNLVCSFFLLEKESLEIKNDSFIGLTIDGIPTTTFPSKDSGKAIGNIECDKGASGYWDYDKWSLRIKNMTQTRTKCQVNFVSKYSESILNGSDPVLKEGLIPVIISDDGVVTKSSLGWEWYNYNNQKWANAVILEDDSKIYYDGETIPESDIESYFVWIPRYKYKIFNEGKYEGLTSVENRVQTIDVVFENKNTPVSNGSTVGSYLTHPAFTSFDTNGIWVGKFETGYKGANGDGNGIVNEIDVSKIQIKPNVYSWRGIQVSNAHLNSYNYQREMDSHMMKNTEWGAVAYLQHSNYGSRIRVRFNNNIGKLTGYGAVHEPTKGFSDSFVSCSSNPNECIEYGTTNDVTLPWNTSIGNMASTTGNISGIYDMSGGSLEFTMGVMKYSDGRPMSGINKLKNSGFNGSYIKSNYGDDTSGESALRDGVDFPDSKYYDLYDYFTDGILYSRRILGDATGEIGSFGTYGTDRRRIGAWYKNASNFVNLYAPWFVRGGAYYSGFEAGMFFFSHDYGMGVSTITFRIVLAF